MKTTRQHCNQQENAVECFKSDIQRMVPILLDPIILRAEVVKLVEDHNAQGVLKPWLDADVEVCFSAIYCHHHTKIHSLRIFMCIKSKQIMHF